MNLPRGKIKPVIGSPTAGYCLFIGLRYIHHGNMSVKKCKSCTALFPLQPDVPGLISNKFISFAVTVAGIRTISG